jgi:phosphoribosyl 1,2-cyclic phosphodiesterase
MEITFYGVRSSVAVPGPETNEFGGNTPCLHVRSAKGYDIVIDAGTGICNLARHFLTTPLGRGQGEVTLLLSHTYLDHIQGFPFFIPAFIPGNRIKVYGGRTPKTDLRTVLNAQLNASYSPIFELSNFASTLMIEEVEKSSFLVDGIAVATDTMPHAAAPSVAYRMEENGRSFVYMIDIEHTKDALSANALALAKDADVLVHDAFFSPEDSKEGCGHSSIDTAIALAKKANVKTLVLSHYSPDYNDSQLNALYDRFKQEPGLKIIAAREGLKLTL